MKFLKCGVLLAAFCLAFAGFASANTLSMGGVTYTFTSGEADGGGVFDVNLEINTTGSGASDLTSFAVQFQSGGTNQTSVALESGPTNWAFIQQGPNGPAGCTKDNSANHYCFAGPGLGSGIFDFTFDVTMPAGTGAPDFADIMAFQGTEWAISKGTDITPPSVPEPASLSMLGAGLLTAGGFLRKKLMRN